MKITTLNINSVRARVEWLPQWLDDRAPDVLCLQELKCEAEQFPAELFESAGYTFALRGQKSYNGVAILARQPITDVVVDFPVPGDGEARGIAATVAGVRVVNLYVVNGKEVGDPHYHRKLAWLDALLAWLDADTSADQDVVVCGDFNIAPTDADVHDPRKWAGQNLCSAPERARLQALLDWGLTDSWRHFHPADTGRYTHTWWPYWAKAFQRGLGLRIDHLLASASVMARAQGCEIDRAARKLPRPTDHAPVTLTID